MPEEVNTDNGKQFTDRFGKRGEVLFDKICRKNGIAHLLTAPESPNQNGKVERFHGTFRPDFLDQQEPFESVAQAQAAVDAWVVEYISERPHQAADNGKEPVTPSQRFAPVPAEQCDLLGLWLPPALETVAPADTKLVEESLPVRQAWGGGRSSSTRSCPRRGTCAWLAGSSGSAPLGRGRRCGFGPAPR